MAKRSKEAASELFEYDELMVGVGKRIAQVRGSRGITRPQLGEMTDLAPSYIYEMETSGANITLKTLGKIATRLRVQPRDLLPEGENVELISSSVAALIISLRQMMTALSERRTLDAQLIKGIEETVSRLEAISTDGTERR